MSVWKRASISLIVFVIAVLCVWFIVLDFSRFISLDYSYDIFPSALLKRINVLLAFLMVWGVGKDGIDIEDSSRMKAAFVFIGTGEAAFLVGERLIGLGMFAVCQILLIIRNSKGLSTRLRHSSQKQKKKLIISGVVIYFIFLVFLLLSGSLIGLNNTSFAAYFYGTILSVSLMAGLGCHILGLLPRKNAELVAAGMICFYCCDVLVGLDAVLWKGLPWLISNSFIWVFYIPALVLLALSCYRYRGD